MGFPNCKKSGFQRVFPNTTYFLDDDKPLLKKKIAETHGIPKL